MFFREIKTREKNLYGSRVLANDFDPDKRFQMDIDPDKLIMPKNYDPDRRIEF